MDEPQGGPSASATEPQEPQESQPGVAYVDEADVLGNSHDSDGDESTDEEDEDESEDEEDGDDDSAESDEDNSLIPSAHHTASEDATPPSPPGVSLPPVPASPVPSPSRCDSGAGASTSSASRAADASGASSLPPIKPSSSRSMQQHGHTSGSLAGLPSPGARSPQKVPRPAPPAPEPPKPKARHDTAHVDPKFLETATYRKVKGIGTVYDWKSQHDVNMQLTRQRKQQAQMSKVLDAAKTQLQLRAENERAFQQWLASKEQERAQEVYNRQKVAYITTVYKKLAREDPAEKREREKTWVGNFASRYDAAVRDKPPDEGGLNRPADDIFRL